MAVVLPVYYLTPKEKRIWILLISGYAFYAVYRWQMLPLLIAFSFLIWFFGRLLDRAHGRLLFIFSLVIALLPLGLLKYTGMGKSWVVPLGLSYFTFKSIGYLADIHTGRIRAEKDALVVLAFVGFFPELLVGPIDRADQLLPQLKGRRLRLSWNLLQGGVLNILGGCFLKMIVADRLGMIVDTVYGNISIYPGPVVVLAAAAYALQIYFDFAGCSLMASGVGRLMGYRLPENFKRPYLAVSVADFWRRWHISLTSWLRDYIYIPLGGNRRGKLRQYCNILIIFLISGIWHGAGLTFIVWGLLNGVFQLAGRATRSYRQRLYRHLPFGQNDNLRVAGQRLGTFFWMMLAWVFFRADSLENAFSIFHQMKIGWLAGDFGSWIMQLGLNKANWILLLICLVLILLISLLQERGYPLLKRTLEKPFAVRCLFFYLLIFGLIIFGIYGTAYHVSDFIYLQF